MQGDEDQGWTISSAGAAAAEAHDGPFDLPPSTAGVEIRLPFGKVTVVSDAECPVGEFTATAEEFRHDPNADARMRLAEGLVGHVVVLRHGSGLVCQCNAVLKDDLEWAVHAAQRLLPGPACGEHYHGTERDLRGADCVLPASHPEKSHRSAQGRQWCR